MKKFLNNIKLIDYLTTELLIQKENFVAILQENVDNGGTGMFAGTFDMFSSSKNEFKGKVTSDGFEIKRRKRFFSSNSDFAVAKGFYTQDANKLIIKTEINGFNAMMIPFYIMITIFYAVFMGIGWSSENTGFGFPFILIHAVFMYAIPYFLMRRSVQKLKRELEREFFYLANKA